MKRILFLFLAFILLGVVATDAKTSKKGKTAKTSSARAALVIYCDLEDAPAKGKMVEKISFYPKSSKRVGVKYKGAQEKTYKVDWVDDQYGDAATYYLYNGDYIGYDLGGGYVVLSTENGDNVYYSIDFEKSNLDEY